MAARLDGRSAIVTGGARGIGAAIAARLVDEGAMVAIADLDGEGAATLAMRLSPDGKQAFGVACDVGSEADVASCVQATLSRYGRLDIVVNNAGMMTFKRIEEWRSADWAAVLQVDLIGAALFTGAAFREMRGGGAIINVSSIHAVQTSAQAAPYAAAKAGMLSLTRTSSIEGREREIRANAILPGAVDTPMLWDNPNIRSGAERIDPADVGQPEDIAAAVAFLASDDARFITGATLTVDGGRLARL
ncbi:MAG: SDR family oxidoreductase [Pseudomonadota bacterium]